MKPTAAVLALILGLMTLTAGAERAPRRLEDLGGDYPLNPNNRIDVALDPADRDRIERWKDKTSPFERRVLAGAAWSTIFAGDPATRPVFRILKSSVTTGFTHENYLQTISYVIDGQLTIGGRIIPIHAQGEASSGRDAYHAFPRAVTACVMSAATQATAAIASAEKSP